MNETPGKARKKVPRGILNNNPGNIRHSKTVWQGMAAAQLDPEFVTFISPEWGIRAMAKVIQTYVRVARNPKDGSPIDTIEEIITRWAPPIENETGAYIKAVDDDHPKAAHDILDPFSFADMEPLIKGITHHENGEQPYDDATIERGLALAFIRKPRSITNDSASTIS